MNRNQLVYKTDYEISQEGTNIYCREDMVEGFLDEIESMAKEAYEDLSNITIFTMDRAEDALKILKQLKDKLY